MISFYGTNKNEAMVCLCLSLLLCGSAVAQSPDAKPKEFYEPGYVTKSVPGKDKSITNGDNSQSVTKQPQASMHPSEIEQLPTIPQPSASLSLSNLKTYKVKAISAVISSIDKEHYESALKEVIDVAQHFDISIDTIYVPGKFENIGQASPLFIPLVARGGTIAFANIPKRWQLTLSPTWVIETSEGEFVLEATGPLAENFNDSGDFVDIPRKVTEITPVPTQTPESAQGKLQELGEIAKGAGGVAPSQAVATP